MDECFCGFEPSVLFIIRQHVSPPWSCLIFWNDVSIIIEIALLIFEYSVSPYLSHPSLSRQDILTAPWVSHPQTKELGQGCVCRWMYTCLCMWVCFLLFLYPEFLPPSILKLCTVVCTTAEKKLAFINSIVFHPVIIFICLYVFGVIVGFKDSLNLTR